VGWLRPAEPTIRLGDVAQQKRRIDSEVLEQPAMDVEMNDFGQLLVRADRSLVIVPGQQQLDDLSLRDRHPALLGQPFSGRAAAGASALVRSQTLSAHGALAPSTACVLYSGAAVARTGPRSADPGATSQRCHAPEDQTGKAREARRERDDHDIVEQQIGDRYLGRKLAEPHKEDVPNLDRVERLPDASHWVHHDEAERVNELLVDFLTSE